MHYFKKIQTLRRLLILIVDWIRVTKHVLEILEEAAEKESNELSEQF